MQGELTTWLVPLISMLAAGLFAGFAAGIFGIGGGFVVVPALFIGNRCTDPTYSGWFLRGRSARDVEELEQWLTKLTRCQTLV